MARILEQLELLAVLELIHKQGHACWAQPIASYTVTPVAAARHRNVDTEAAARGRQTKSPRTCRMRC